MHKSRSVLLGLLIIILLPSTFGCIAASASADSAVPSSQISPQAANSPSAVESNAVSSLPQAASGPIAVPRYKPRARRPRTAETGGAAWQTLRHEKRIEALHPDRLADGP